MKLLSSLRGGTAWHLRAAETQQLAAPLVLVIVLNFLMSYLNGFVLGVMVCIASILHG